GAEPGLRFRSRTNRQEPFRREFENLENPIVVEFVNAREDADRIKFFSKYGLLFVEKLIHPAAKNFGSDYDFVIASQTELRDSLTKATGPQVDALQAINSSLGRYGPINLQPTFDLGGAAGAPRMVLKFSDLMQFMAMENRHGRDAGRQARHMRTLRRGFSHRPVNRATISRKILQRPMPRSGNAGTQCCKVSKRTLNGGDNG
ncbi:MAG: hypothetical protein WB041_22870, partial [Pseudolabrys sp.]